MRGFVASDPSKHQQRYEMAVPQLSLQLSACNPHIAKMSGLKELLKDEAIVAAGLAAVQHLARDKDEKKGQKTDDCGDESTHVQENTVKHQNNQTNSSSSKRRVHDSYERMSEWRGADEYFAGEAEHQYRG